MVEPNLRAAEASIKALDKFHGEVTKVWSQEKHCVIGHVVYAPSITVSAGAKRYTEDWALIELHRSKIDWADFRGNVINLDTFYSILLWPSILTAISRHRDYARQIYFTRPDGPLLAGFSVILCSSSMPNLHGCVRSPRPIIGGKMAQPPVR